LGKKEGHSMFSNNSWGIYGKFSRAQKSRQRLDLSPGRTGLKKLCAEKRGVRGKSNGIYYFGFNICLGF
jgi:hypothetical protein